MAYAEKRGNGPTPWRVRFQLPDGSWDSASGFATKTDALNHGRDQETDVRRKVFIDPARDMRLDEYVPLWLDALELRWTSENGYRGRLRARILPQWGDSTLRELEGQVLQLRAWVKAMRKEGLAENTISGYTSLLRVILDDAVTEGRIGRNPLRAGFRPKGRGRYQKSARKKAGEEASKIISSPRQALFVAQNARLRWLKNPDMGEAIILTLAYTGLRIGELAGLEREDLQLVGGEFERYLNLTYQLQPTAHGRARVEPKYESDRRLILPPFLADKLTHLLTTHTSQHVFTSLWGGKITTSGPWYDLWDTLTEGRNAVARGPGRREAPAIPAVEGVEGMTPHGFRHGHKTWLEEDQIPRPAVEYRLGHTLPGVEGDYPTVTAEMDLMVARALQARWKGSIVVDASREDVAS